VKKLARYALTAVLAAWVITNPASADATAHKIEHLFGQAAHSLSTLATGL
jgi:hypothetical protein